MTIKLLTTNDLKTATGCTRMKDLEECLKKNGVRYLYGKRGIYTTTDAINAAMGLKTVSNQQANDIEIL